MSPNPDGEWMSDVDLDADINDCCHGVEGPCRICDPELFNDDSA